MSRAYTSFLIRGCAILVGWKLIWCSQSYICSLVIQFISLYKENVIGSFLRDVVFVPYCLSGRCRHTKTEPTWIRINISWNRLVWHRLCMVERAPNFIRYTTLQHGYHMGEESQLAISKLYDIVTTKCHKVRNSRHGYNMTEEAQLVTVQAI